MATIESVSAPMISRADAPEALAGSSESLMSHCAHVSTPPRFGAPAAGASPPTGAVGARGAHASATSPAPATSAAWRRKSRRLGMYEVPRGHIQDGKHLMRSAEVVIVGGGPAGVAAAITAAQSGAATML